MAGKCKYAGTDKVKTIPSKIITPWNSWTKGENPDWWTEHNKVKHQRDLHFDKANLGNVLRAAAGLLVFLTYWNQPKLWRPNFPCVFALKSGLWA
jgi:hypothetical protein